MQLERRFKKEIPSLEEVFAFLKEFVKQQELKADLEFSLTFLAEEIFTNMVKYNTGSNHDILVGVERNGDQVVLQLTDFDVEPFDPEEVEEFDVDAPLEERRPGGLGLHLVKSMADKLVFEYQNRELTVIVYKNVS